MQRNLTRANSFEICNKVFSDLENDMSKLHCWEILLINNLLLDFSCTSKVTLMIFYFLLPIRRESIVLGSNFRNGDFDAIARFEVL